MVFKCQEDSYLREFETAVASCQPSNFEITVAGRKTKLDGYEIICDDTILFPEGGGQPYDLGFLNDTKVYKVLRRGDQAVHYVTESFTIGDSIKQVVDWDRRFDHMQQHSGQHLLSAILEQDYKYQTVSWWLGEDTSYVELETPNITEDEIKMAEMKVNRLIRCSIPITVSVYNKDTPEEILKETRSVKDLPEDHEGDIRVINIDGIDKNMCCGTHVTNLSQLQVVKLLHWEKSTRKNQILLHFLVGNRVINRLDQCIKREQKITTLLNGGPSEHVNLTDKLIKNMKTCNTNLQSVLKLLLQMEIDKLKNLNPKPKYFSYHRKEAGADFINNFIRKMGYPDVFLFLSIGDEKGSGNITLYGQESDVSQLGTQICEILQGKGAGNGNRYQAKVTKMLNRDKADKLIEKYFENKAE